MARGKKDEDVAYDLEPAPAELEGKQADEREVLRWVARHIDAPAPDPADCPDPFAWTLLRQCRSVPGFAPFFIEKLWSKLIPSKAQLEDDTGKAIDGKPTLDLIEQILAMRDEAEGRTAPVAGPEEEVDAFEAFDPEEDA